MTAVTEAATRPQVMRDVAAALNNEMAAAVEDFLSSNAAALEGLSSLTRAQLSGPDSWPQNVVQLVDEAQHRWDLLATGWAAHLLPPEVREAGADYVRPRIPVQRVVPLAADWESSIGVTNWSRGR